MENEFASVKDLFPRYKPSKEEIAWINKYQNTTGFELLCTEEVENAEGFLAMASYNIQWFKDWTVETLFPIEELFHHLQALNYLEEESDNRMTND